MEIEVSQIEPYLPYGLKAEMLDYKIDYVNKQYDTIVGIHEWDHRGELWCCLTEGGSKPPFNKIKPILRPLSDLLKPIDKDKKFGKNILDGIIEELNGLIGDCTLTADLCLIQNVSSDTEFMSFTYMDQMSEVLNILFKDHYDVFGLIEAGLAIDINTLPKEVIHE